MLWFWDISQYPSQLNPKNGRFCHLIFLNTDISYPTVRYNLFSTSKHWSLYKNIFFEERPMPSGLSHLYKIHLTIFSKDYLTLKWTKSILYQDNFGDISRRDFRTLDHNNWMNIEILSNSTLCQSVRKWDSLFFI